MNSETAVTVVVPTFNAGTAFYKFCEMLQAQTANIEKVIVVDSSSADRTAETARQAGFFVKTIDKKEFGHGKTRQMALETVKTDVVCFLTQDALLKDETSVDTLVSFLMQDNKLGAVYGRQLPYPHTGPLGRFARYFNYPEKSFINGFADKKNKGFKTAFLSDSFAAYKKSILLEVGGFPLYSSFGEDSYVAARMLTAGYKTGYCAEAAVYHSHDFSLGQEWKRSREIKKFHDAEPWLLQTFGKPEGEGVKFVMNQFQWLIDQGYWYMIPSAVLHNAVKFIGYKMG